MNEFVGVFADTVGSADIYSKNVRVKILQSAKIRHESLKQKALLFDHLAYIGAQHNLKQLDAYLTSPTGSIFPDAEDSQWAKQIVNELEWLLDQGIIVDYEFDCSKILWRSQEVREALENLDKAILDASRLSQIFCTAAYFGYDRHDEWQDEWQDIEEVLRLKHDKALAGVERFSELAAARLARVVSLDLSTQGLDAFPVLPSLSSFDPIAPQQRGIDAVHVVLKCLPVPSESTPWEQIIEFRNDPESRGKLFALRKWMRNISKSATSYSEITEELECLLYEYKRHLHLHRLKFETGVLETLLVTSAEIVENLVKFKWSKATKSLFELKKKKLALLEGEMKIPGSEIAYIAKVKDRFVSTAKL